MRDGNKKSIVTTFIFFLEVKEMEENILFERDGKTEERMFDLENPYDRGVIETWRSFGWTAKDKNGKAIGGRKW